MWGIFDGEKKKEPEPVSQESVEQDDEEDEEMPYYKIICDTDVSRLAIQINEQHAEHDYEVLTMAQSTADNGEINYTVILELYEE